MDAQAYRQAFERLGTWTESEAAEVCFTWLDAVFAFIEADGDESQICNRCGSLGEFGSGADWLADWLMEHGYDPYPLWDLHLALEERFDNSHRPDTVPLDRIRRLADRTILIQRRLSLAADPRKTHIGGRSYLPADIKRELRVSDTTLNTYAKAAGVKTPGRGQRGHRYTAEDRDRILAQFRDTSPEPDVVAAAKRALENRN